MQPAIKQPIDTETAGHGDHPTARGFTTQLKDVQKTLPLRVLTAEDWRHWVTRGFVIVRGAVPVEQCEAAIDMLWTFQELSLIHI